MIIETNDDYLESPLVLMKACNGDGKSIIYVLLLWWLIIFEYFDRKIFISLVAIIEKLLISKLAIAVIISSKIEKGLRFNIIQVAINLILIYIAFFFLDAFVCEVVKRQKEKRFREVS